MRIDSASVVLRMQSHRLLADTSRPKLGPPATALRCSLAATGRAVPATSITNAELIAERDLDTTDQWIREKTGIIERRFVEEHEGVVSLATTAALEALEKANVAPDEIDIIVVATCSSETVIPTAAAAVQGDLMATNAVAWDINSACSGFSFAFDSVLRHLQTTGRYGLVIGADCGSRLVDPNDRLTSIFFGDGAAAVLIDSAGQGAVLATHLETSGSRDPLSVPAGGFMQMDGKAVWNYATSTLPRIVRQLCDSAGCQLSDLDAIVSHQANANILAHAAASLDLPTGKFPCNIARYGNTLAASIPLAMHDAMQTLNPDKQHLIAMVGFGGGLSAGGHLWQINPQQLWSNK